MSLYKKEEAHSLAAKTPVNEVDSLGVEIVERDRQTQTVRHEGMSPAWRQFYAVVSRQAGK